MATRLTTLQVGGATLVALAASVVGFFSGDIYSTGTINGQTLSGSTLTLGGGAVTITKNSNGFALGNLQTITGATLSGSVVNGGGAAVTIKASGVSDSGALTVKGVSRFQSSLTAVGAISGSTLHIQGGGITNSGTLVVLGNSFFQGTVQESGLEKSGTSSGSYIFANLGLSSSGTLVIKGIARFQNTVTTTSTLSGGSTLTLSPLGTSPTFKVLCPKAGGVIGTMTVTATGTVLKTCN